MDIRSELYKLADSDYKKFQIKLIPGINEDEIIGVRMPNLRKLGKSLENDDFSYELYEERLLHGFYIGYNKNLSFEERLRLLDILVPRLKNWAECDGITSTFKFVDKNKPEYFDYIQKYLRSDKEIERRFGIVSLMQHYITDEYIDFIIDYISSLSHGRYYVDMAAAWCLATAYLSFPQKVYSLLSKRDLDGAVRKMAVSKLCDSFRVSAADKERLKKLRKI